MCTLQVPRTVYIENAIPKSATGKVQRRNIAQQYADAAAAAATAVGKGRERPASRSHGELQTLVQQAWQDVLGSPPKDTQHNFFSQGATSMDAIAFAGKLGNSTGQPHLAGWRWCLMFLPTYMPSSAFCLCQSTRMAVLSKFSSVYSGSHSQQTCL